MTDTDIVFVAGGKWTTYREMAQDAVDKVTDPRSSILFKVILFKFI